MDFESPDVEREFPGLYSSETVRKTNESDFSDESHEKSFKSDLIAKKKDKKDSKKDRGYAALEGESSEDEGDTKSPSKTKKTKSFKFPVKNKAEKREKSREKELKDKDADKEKKKEKDKKEKSKLKDKKKGKVEDVTEADEHAVFGVALDKAVERLGCLDGVGIPLPIRHCIDCIQSAGLSCETLYKTPQVKTKLQTIKKSYNSREPVSTADIDVALASSLLLLFLRELPEHILTGDLVARFEEAAATKEVAEREEKLATLLDLLPPCNRELVAWLMVHFDHVTQHEDINKMNAQSIAMTFSPILQMSHRLLTAFLCHCKSLFSDVVIHKYIPPLPPGSTFPDDPPALTLELQKQEGLLSQLHRDMSEGFVSKAREEQLWEVQRIVTQLKRKLKSFQKKNDTSQMQKSLEEENLAQLKVNQAPQNIIPESAPVPAQSFAGTSSEDQTTSATVIHERDDPALSKSTEIPFPTEITQKSDPPEELETKLVESTVEEVENRIEPALGLVHQQTNVSSTELRLQLENAQLHQLYAKLQEKLDQERHMAAKFRTQIEAYRGFIDSDSDDSSAGSTPAYLSPETQAKLEQLMEENHNLMAKRDELSRRIMEEREACVKLNVSINFIKLMNKCNS